MSNPLLRKTIYKLILYFLVILILVWILAPFTWLMISSVSTKKDLISIPLHWLPKRINLEGYKKIFLSGEYGGPAAEYKKAALNSFLVATFVTLISIGLGSIAAFSFSRYKSKFLNATFITIIISYMLPPISIAIPIYLILSKLHLLNTIGALIFVYCSFDLPLAIWFMKEFFDGIPVDLEEAALIDGCTRFKTLWKIVMPLSAPGISSTGIFIFIISWNEFFFALLYTLTLKSKTLPVLIGEFSSKVGEDYIMMATAGVLASIPPVIIALVFQKFIISGLTAGGVKG